MGYKFNFRKGHSANQYTALQKKKKNIKNNTFFCIPEKYFFVARNYREKFTHSVGVPQGLAMLLLFKIVQTFHAYSCTAKQKIYIIKVIDHISCSLLKKKQGCLDGALAAHNVYSISKSREMGYIQ